MADSGYLDGSPEESEENWLEEWFYLPDVPLEDPPRAGLITPFMLSPPKKWYSWRPKSWQASVPPVVAKLVGQVLRQNRGETNGLHGGVSSAEWVGLC